MWYEMSCGCTVNVDVGYGYGCAGDCCTSLEVENVYFISNCESHTRDST